MSISTWKRDGFEISTDLERLDKSWLLGALAKTYWAAENTPETLWNSVQHARGYGIYGPDGAQVGFARAVTDMARFAWISDVVIDDEARGRGLGKWLMETMVSDPALKTVHLWTLATDDAHGLYEKSGFELTAQSALAEQFMHLKRQKM